MKFVGVLGMVAGAGILMACLSGCESLSETSGQNWNDYKHTSATNMLMLPDDVKYLLLMDHPVYLSRRPIGSD